MVHWKLITLLNIENIAPHKLGIEAGILPSSIYRLIRDDGAENVSRKTLSKIIVALRTLTGKDISVSDLLEFVDKD